MSANNWRTCPACKVKALAEKELAKLKAGKAYGKVSADKYLRLLKQVDAKPELEETFREDYGIGMREDGKFYVSYSGGCTECGWGHRFEHEEKLDPGKKEKPREYGNGY